MVSIEHQQGDRAPIAYSPAPFRIEAFVESAAIGQHRYGIDNGQPFHDLVCLQSQLFSAFSIGYVPNDDKNSGANALSRMKNPNAGLHPDKIPIPLFGAI